MKTLLISAAVLALAGCASDPGSQSPGAGGMVKITSLGSHDGELCPLDRAIPASARSTPCCSATCTATTWAT